MRKTNPVKHRFYPAILLALATFWIPASILAASKPIASHSRISATFIRPKVQCPSQLETLIPLLLRDLPSYANRVSQRAYTDDYRTRERPGYVLLAGRPEYEPLTLEAGEYISASESEVPQVFFTTLERQYFSEEAFRLQHYHWLFLTQTENGWRFVLMLSTVGDYPSDEPPTPPRDSSQGVIAQAIRLWLRDCQAGSIRL
jgi:hypothetical protein